MGIKFGASLGQFQIESIFGYGDEFEDSFMGENKFTGDLGVLWGSFMLKTFFS